MEITSTDIVKRIDQVLSEQRISYLEVCRGAGITDHSITDWKGTKNKRGSMPSADKLFKVASYLKISLYWLLTGEDEAGLIPEQRNLLQNYDKLDKRDKQTVLDLIETMLKKQKKEEKDVYPATRPVSLETTEPEPAYPQLLKVQKQPKIDNNVTFVPTYYVPFYGKVAAGRPIDINIFPHSVIPVPEPILKGDKTGYYSVEVKGTSMTDAGIKDGNCVIIRRAEEPENGEIMLVRYANESTLKRIRINRQKEVYLCWEDGSGREIKVDSDEYEIQGRLVTVLWKPEKR
jgi:SOS-response transcriptional repressor LexA